MGNPLIGIVDVEQGNAGCATGRTGFGDESFAALHQGGVAAARAGVDNMVHYRKYPGGIDQFATCFGQRFQRRCTGAFMQEYPVDRDQCIAVAQIGNDMGVPDLFEKSFRLSQFVPPGYASRA